MNVNKEQSNPRCNDSCGQPQGREVGRKTLPSQEQTGKAFGWVGDKNCIRVLFVCCKAILPLPVVTSRLDLNTQLDNFCTTALFHHSEILHKHYIIKTAKAFPDSFLAFKYMCSFFQLWSIISTCKKSAPCTKQNCLADL